MRWRDKLSSQIRSLRQQGIHPSAILMTEKVEKRLKKENCFSPHLPLGELCMFEGVQVFVDKDVHSFAKVIEISMKFNPAGHIVLVHDEESYWGG